MKNKISMRQAGILILILIFSNKVLLLPALMFDYVKGDAVISLILIFALEFISVPILLKLKQTFQDQKLYDILQKYLTKYVAKVLYVIFLIFIMLKAILTFSIVYVYFKQQIYQEEFVSIALIAFLPIMNHATISGLKPMARTMELFFFVILCGFLFCLGIAVYTPLSVPDFFVASAGKIFNSIYRYAFAFGDFIFLFMMIEKIDYKKSEEKKIYFYAILGYVLVILLFVLFYAKYEMTSFMHNDALADLLAYSVRFNAIGRLDIIAILTLLFTTIFQMEIFCYAFCDSLINIFPLMDKRYSVAIFDVFFLILYYVFIGNYEIMVDATVTYFPPLGIFIAFVFPILIWIISRIERRKNEKTT